MTFNNQNESVYSPTFTQMFTAELINRQNKNTLLIITGAAGEASVVKPPRPDTSQQDHHMTPT